MKNLFSIFVAAFFSFVLTVSVTNSQTPVNGGVLNGKAIKFITPEYPAAAKAIKAEGQVQVQIIIDEKGSVVSAKAISGHPLLREAAQDAALQSEFKPILVEGKPSKTAGILVYNFGNSSDIKSNSQIPKRITGGILNGKAISLPKPEYPAAAKAVSASGTVYVQVNIDEDGSVIKASAVSGHPLLRNSAEKAASGAKFEPTYLSGKAVRVSGVVVYNFSGNNSDQVVATTKAIALGVVNGKSKNLEKPSYPAAAKAVKAEGAVQIFVLIDEAGKVIEAKATSGHVLLRNESEKAAMKSTFQPFMMDGVAVKATGIIVYNFFAANEKID